MSDAHTVIRPAAVAGMFYSADPDQLQSDVAHYLQQATSSSNFTPKAIIAPHAGYIYSGPIAASAYKLLQPARHLIKQIILLGPSHRVAFRGIATPNADYFSTPLGNIKINRGLCEQIESLDFVHANAAAHAQEHSLEVQLPFLQNILDDFELTPLVVGDCDAQDVAKLLDSIWGKSDTLVVISSDLSHYHNYPTAKQLDQKTSLAIENCQPENISYEDACGRTPLNGLLTLAKQKHLSIDTLDLRNSGDTAGDKERVVGYGAYVVH
jgi:MEMO1 family protein